MGRIRQCVYAAGVGLLTMQSAAALTTAATDGNNGATVTNAGTSDTGKLLELPMPSSASSVTPPALARPSVTPVTPVPHPALPVAPATLIPVSPVVSMVSPPAAPAVQQLKIMPPASSTPTAPTLRSDTLPTPVTSTTTPPTNPSLPSAPLPKTGLPLPSAASSAVTSPIAALSTPASPFSNGSTPAATPENPKSYTDLLAKYPDIIFEPLDIKDISLLFNKKDSTLIQNGLDIYDKSVLAPKAEVSAPSDDLSSLLNSLRPHDRQPAEAPPPLPNLYLGSILYYSPGNWSVWINGKKLTNMRNSPDKELYVLRLSRTEIELAWRPVSLQEVPTHWKQLTGNGAHPLPHVRLDEKKGTLTLDIKPNQTFIPRDLAIREGLIISSHITPVPTDLPNATPQAGALGTQDIYNLTKTVH